jgi:hypothetical protein
MSWKYSTHYQAALMERANQDKFWICSFVGPAGPYFAAPDESGIISSAAQALAIAEKFPDQREWWTWVAGWYPDCPESCTKHIDKQ